MRKYRRHDHRLDESRTTAHRRKDTRRWCRGKVGVAHVIEERIWYTFGRYTTYIGQCVNCGRKDWGLYRTEKGEET